MDRFDDVVILTERILKIKVNYVHYNPVKAGLVSRVEDWKYLSARNYLFDDHSILKVNTNWDFDFEMTSNLQSGRNRLKKCQCHSRECGDL